MSNFENRCNLFVTLSGRKLFKFVLKLLRQRYQKMFSMNTSKLTLFEFYLSYQEHREIGAAQGVKIAAKELEKTVAGLNLLVANHQDEIEICKEEMEKRLQSALQSFKVKDRGVFVQASTLGSLEALLAFLKDSKIPVSLYLV